MPAGAQKTGPARVGTRPGLRINLVAILSSRQAVKREEVRPYPPAQGLTPHDINADVSIDVVLIILRKEVIQPQVPLRLPCYDLVPIAEFIFGA